MGSASSLEPGDTGYDPDVGEAGIPSRVDGAAPGEDPRSYDELSDAECERLAAPQGWKPLAVYNGRPGGWSNARDFLKRADAEMPILRAQNRRMTERLANYDNEFASLRQTVGAQANTIAEQTQILHELREFSRNASEEGYKRARAELEAKQDEAASNADQTVVRQTREQIRALDDSRASAAPPRAPARAEPGRDRQPPPPPGDPEVQRAFAALKLREPWIGHDAVLTRALIDTDAENVNVYPNMPVAERFDISVASVKEHFPQYFPAARRGTGDEEIELAERREPAPPARPGSRPAQQLRRQQVASPDTIASIADADDRAQARAAFERYKRQFSDYTEKEYMAVYNNPKIDERQLRQEARKRAQ
jgi:hypothetical protein